MGDKYPANSNTVIHPEVLVKFFEDLLPKLYAIFNFNIAMVGFEVGGMYDLEYFETNRAQEDNSATLFYVGKKEYATVHNSNKNLLKVLN